MSHCFAWALSSCGEWERPFVPVCGLLSVPAPGAELGPEHSGFRAGTQARLLHGMWDLQTPIHCTTKEAPVSFLLVLRTHLFSVMIRLLPLAINQQHR